MKIQSHLTKSLILISLSTASLSFAAPNSNGLILKESKQGFQSLLEAQFACIQSGSPYLRHVRNVICQPTAQTNIRRLAWSEIATDTVYAGSVSSSSVSFSSWSSSISAIFQGFASVFLSDSGSSFQSSYRETPVYNRVNKRIDLYREEAIESYGYQLFLSTERVIANTAPVSELTRSQEKFQTEAQALKSCAEISSILYGFTYESQCHTEALADGHLIWILNGKLAVVPALK